MPQINMLSQSSINNILIGYKTLNTAARFKPKQKIAMQEELSAHGCAV